MVEQYVDEYKRVWGDKDITNIIAVNNQNNSLIIEMHDSTTYTVLVPTGTYGFSDIIRKADVVNEINNQFQGSNVPIKCYVGGVRGGSRRYNCIVFQPTDDKTINVVDGTFATDFFLN